MEQDQYLKQFGPHLKGLRLKRNLSIKKVSEICSMTEQEVIQLENGENDPNILLIRKIADAFDVKLHEMFSFDTEI